MNKVTIDLKFKVGDIVYNAHFEEFVRIDRIEVAWWDNSKEPTFTYDVFSRERNLYYETNGNQFVEKDKSSNPFKRINFRRN